MLKQSNLGHFLIKLPNKVTYLLETQVLGLFALDESITHKHEFLNVSQRWSVEFGITPRYGLRHLLRMTQTAGNPIPEQPGRVLRSYARLIATACKDSVVFTATPQECRILTSVMRQGGVMRQFHKT